MDKKDLFVNEMQKGSVNMPFKIKVRLAELGKKQVDLLSEFAKRGLKVNPTELSLAISGRNQQPKMGDILSAANEIISEWERIK